jgi:chromate transporter
VLEGGGVHIPVMTDVHAAEPAPGGVPNEGLWSLFRRFLRFGLLAWGGPVAQIAMIREQLVEREQWISRERFNRVLAVYQALPGPEAHELCVYFGMLARGRAGAIVAGLGFMLPGLVLMLLLSWAYVRFGLVSPLWRGALLGCQGAVVALIVRATVRIGGGALSSPMLWGIAVAAVGAQLAGGNAIVVLALAGAVHATWARRGTPGPDGRHGGLASPALLSPLSQLVPALQLPVAVQLTASAAAALPAALPTLTELLASGLRAGLLTFGGAYTAIPFLRADAVVGGGWMTDAQFVDGLALSSVLPAPFIIFSTFVGFLGGGLIGALVLTAGVFLPAFAFTLAGHDQLERLVERPGTHAFLDGVTAGVVGVIAVTAWTVGQGVLTSALPVATFVCAMVALFRFRAPATVAWVMGGAALLGMVVARG